MFQTPHSENSLSMPTALALSQGMKIKTYKVNLLTYLLTQSSGKVVSFFQWSVSIHQTIFHAHAHTFPITWAQQLHIISPIQQFFGKHLSLPLTGYGRIILLNVQICPENADRPNRIMALGVPKFINFNDFFSGEKP